MSLIFQNGSRTQSYGPGEKMPALPQQPKASFGKPPGSSQDDYLLKQPAGGTQYAGGAPDWRNVGKPGQAQSTPAPSQGTKYGAYSPRPPSSQTTGDPRGMLANASPSQRPPPLQMGVAQTPWGQSMDPFAERDAFVRQIGQQRINNQIAFNTSGPQAPQGSPFINYDMARQNAGLAGGAPSMNANPADTFIGRFNNQYGATNPGSGGGQPTGGWAAPGSNVVNAQIQQWAADQRRNAPQFPPGVSSLAWKNDPSSPLPAGWEWQRAHVGSRSEGWMPVQSAGGQSQQAYYPGGEGGFPVQPPPQSPGRAQPIAQQQSPTGYNPGMPVRSAADSPTSPEYQKWRSGQAQTMQWLGPEGEAKREADMHRRWMEETGRAPASGDFRPKPGAPQGPRMPYAGGMDYEQGPPVQRPGLTLRPPPRRTGMAGYQTSRRR